MHFLHRHIPAFLHLGTPDRASAWCWEAILNRETTNKKHRSTKNMAKIDCKKGHLFTIWERKPEGRLLPCLTSVGNMHIEGLKIFTALPTSANGCRWSASTDFGVTNDQYILASRWIPKCRIRITINSILVTNEAPTRVAIQSPQCLKYSTFLQ